MKAWGRNDDDDDDVEASQTCNTLSPSLPSSSSLLLPLRPFTKCQTLAGS